jgi:hypothetical protein
MLAHIKTEEGKEIDKTHTQKKKKKGPPELDLNSRPSPAGLPRQAGHDAPVLSADVSS